MKIDAQHITEPGLVVLDITAADEDTARAVMAAMEQRWATSGITPVRSEPGLPGCGRACTPTSGAPVTGGQGDPATTSVPSFVRRVSLSVRLGDE
ncbi:DUF6207 family protein [Streptomyces sp. NPDC088146]|uniref:DUF6207 family protein n=1 Tax=Streptomyces sp. NPDC088146 TaxID=3365829 RepID=UPI0037FDECDB